METVDASSRQSAALPPINYLDIEKIKREEAEYQRKHSAAAMPSSPFCYSGPPPPYSHSVSSANLVAGGQPAIISPPESRRTSGDEKEQRPQVPPRQSLPSIHEALATDQSLPYPVHPPPPANHTSRYPPQQPSSLPAYTEHRPHAVDGQNRGTPLPQAQPAARSPYMGQRQHPPPPPPPPPSVPAPQPSYQSEQLPRPSFSSPHNPRLSTLQPLRTPQSPVSSIRSASSYSSRQQTSPTYSQGQMHQPFGYGYTYSSQYQPPVPLPPSSGPIYSPSTAYAPPPRYQQSNWRPNGTDFGRAEESRGSGRLSGLAYGESVKRHLDNFDLEASLNEIAEGSGLLLEFARHYGRSAHQTQRSGPVTGSLPKVIEVEELMQKQQRIHDSLARIRDVLTQQAALAEQAQDQRFKAPDGRDQNEQNGYQDDGRGGGFAGSDPKKRRGRAAPPGRCHSCNRAETPEWRRGPDGARTLCNACGLHYAKLTRKMGTNKGAAGSSNLRPKSLGPGSPAA